MRKKKMMPPTSTPIPGMGMTSELGSRPWQRPPEMTTLDEAVAFYVRAFTDKKFLNAYFNAIEAGMPVTAMADTMIKTSVMEGKHTIDVGMLVAPILVEALLDVAEQTDIDYITGLEDEDGMSITPSAMSAILSKSANMQDPMMKEAREEMQEAVQDVPKGLLAKRGDK